MPNVQMALALSQWPIIFHTIRSVCYHLAKPQNLIPINIILFFFF